ncbi:GNAT family N-acetyltransferase [Saccharothrix sp. NPDC042600]|uniref:GNAT family N-acetyltransferase n=1 Tax=Saccharothrix TaxID=2071 RepID=UPI0033E6DB61|nr:GNAT family N-acetyltransferase [Saccharothrix mutabilis subsp. capreolus]
MQIRRVTSHDDVMAAAHLFDDPPKADATRAFLADDRHHLLIAYVGDEPAGFVSGVETTHPDKGTEMFLYELGVDEDFQRRGIGTALVEALLALARQRGCYGAFTATEPDNTAALATYARTRADTAATVSLSWTF